MSDHQDWTQESEAYASDAVVEESTQPTEAQAQSDWTLSCLTIAECAPLYEKLKGHLNDDQPVLLDISNCQEIDTAGLQFLAAIQNDPEVNLRVRWTQPSEEVARKASRLGLTSWIEAGAVGAMA